MLYPQVRTQPFLAIAPRLPRLLTWAHTFVLTQEQGSSQPSVHDGLLIQDGGRGSRELEKGNVGWRKKEV